MTSLNWKFSHRLKAIQRLGWFQRGFRWVLRGFWLGALIFLTTWLLNYFFDWLPVIWLRLGFSAAAMLVLFLVALFSRPRLGDLVWRMDRRLDLKESLSTAKQVAQQNSSLNPVEEALIDDANQRLPEVHLQILRFGWGIGRDFLVLVIVVLALVVMFVLTFPLPKPPTIPLPGAGDGLVPALGGEPSAEDIFPGGAPGMPDPSKSQSEDEVPGDLAEILEEVAEELQKDPQTASLADAFASPDLDEAADALDEIAADIRQLPEDVQRDLGETFSDAAADIQDLGYQTLGDAFADAGQSLSEDLDSKKGDLENLADALRDFDGEPAPEPTQPPDPATPEPIERLSGEGQYLELDMEEASDSSLLIPSETTGDGEATGEMTPGEVYDDEDVVDTILVPASYPWYWQDLISNYFTP